LVKENPEPLRNRGYGCHGFGTMVDVWKTDFILDEEK
jgi:hypothetical protein